MAKNSGASSASSSSMEYLLMEDLDFIQVEEQGLSHWEFVNASDAESDREELEEETEEDKENHIVDGIDSLGSEISTPICLRIEQIETHDDDVDVDRKCNGGYYSYGRGYDGDSGYVEKQFEDEDENDDDHDGDDEYGLDDELVPWNVSNKIGRQRMRKLGKREFPKMYNSKRSPYLFVRPGCVRGKYGLGLKHNF
ncbi:protein bfr2-like [Juglans microcarpa x Juglans regia]|uniref:protein bfr2-like n=1 Tax=Juglans microcarpa x Juglans regia TaxID=2249226 RepID=UPI001B7E2200|nr:protein bfr2-like [Juglans microcarpa x Juglans regia]